MCGIAGFLSADPRGDVRSILTAMTDAIAHRGPDDSGAWFDETAGIALGQRRLAIIDLSPAGHQPMASHSGRYMLVFNGEIYNFASLRAELEAMGAAPAWRGHSDTEVMLAAIDHWGFADTLPRLNGMFAIALWDRSRRVLSLARDRAGEKPLYYGSMRGSLLFGSELKALQRHPDFTGELNRDALALFMRHNYVPAPHSIWRGIAKLPPASYVEFDETGTMIGVTAEYWSMRDIAVAGAAAPLTDNADRVDELEALLKDAVTSRMVADVPLGAFLSGGVDSSTIVALMQASSSRPVKTFSIGFSESEFDEAVHAKVVARHLGTEHTELYVTPNDALDVIPDLPAMWDEPFADSSQIPTFLVSRMTRAHVKVALSGDAGDELFGGYNRYFLAPKLWGNARRIPEALRPAMAAMLRRPATARAASAINALLPTKRRFGALADRLPKVAELLETDRPQDLYRRLVSHWHEPERLVLGAVEPATPLTEDVPPFADFRQTMMYLDTITYLPDDILAKVDRASMAVSLETRVPFLDPRVIEFAWQLPMSAKVRGGVGKHILREVLYRHVPRSLIERPKMGFGVPIERWLVGPLRKWAEALLDERRLREEGVFDPAPIRRMWEEHLAGVRRWHYQLWDVLMFQAWWEQNASVETRGGSIRMTATG